MTQQKIPNQWQLQDTGEAHSQWVLRESEQALPPHLQLQAASSAASEAWQPVEVTSTASRGRGGWVLGSLVIVALLAVAAYLAWFVLNGNQNPANTADNAVPAVAGLAGAATETPVSADAPAAPEPTATPAPTNTPIPEPTATPTPVLVEKRMATMTSPYGVNARNSPSVDGELVKLLNTGEIYMVVDGPQSDATGTQWLQLRIDNQTSVWVAAEFVTVASQTVTAEQLIADYKGLGLEPPASLLPAPEASAASAVTTTAPITATTALTVTSPATATTAPTTTIAPPVAPTTVLTAAINSPAGLNARSAPATIAAVVTLLNDKSVHPVVDRSADGLWLQLQLPDGQLAWVLAEFATVSGDLNALAARTAISATAPVTSAAPVTTTAINTTSITTPVTTTGALTTTAPVTTTAALTTTKPLTSTEGVTLTVTNLAGVNARQNPSGDAPAVELFAWNATLPVNGRTEDGQWIQITRGDGTVAWVASGAVRASVEIARLPVVK